MNAPFTTTQLDLFSAFAAQVVPTMPPAHHGNDPANIPFKDATGKQKPKPDRTLQKKLSELRRLHEEINASFYTTKPTELPQIITEEDAAALVAPFIQNLDHEELWIMLLNTKMRVLKLVRLYSGSLNSAAIRVGEVFKDAILESAMNLIIFHNHPSGDPTPSPEDVSITRNVHQAGLLLDINVLDHIIIGYNKITSLKRRGLGFPDKPDIITIGSEIPAPAKTKRSKKD